MDTNNGMDNLVHEDDSLMNYIMKTGLCFAITNAIISQEQTTRSNSLHRSKHVS